MESNSHSTQKKGLLRIVGEILTRCIYRIDVTGREHLPDGGYLLVPNHVTWVDAVILQAAFGRPIRFLVHEPIYRQWWLNPIFKLLKAIPIASTRAKEGIKKAAELIRQGEVVCIFPEGELSRTGTLLKLRRGYEIIAREADAPVVPIWLDQLWGSIFSFYGGKFFKKIPRCLPYPVVVAFGKPISAECADISTVRQVLLELGEQCYQQRPALKGHLGEACLRGLKKRQFQKALVDGIDNSEMNAGMLLAAGIALSRYIKKKCIKNRVAVIVPPSRGAVIGNFATMLAGKVPVNMNFTAGVPALEAAIRIAELEDVITAKSVAKKFPDIPWPKHVHYLEEIIPQIKGQIIFWRIMVLLLPWWILTRWLGLPKTGDHKEAVLLFTSGSSGEPKGVVLSHRNILANVSQFGLMLNLNESDSVLASLPFFHSFGCTVTLWYPLIEGIRMVTYPNPLDVPKNAELIEKHGITLLLATPTFLRGYIKRARKEQLESVHLIVTGAEKLPRELANAFEEKFEKKVMEGYGLTETAPVASVNLPEPKASRPNDTVQPSARAGSVGKLAPGVAAQIRDPESGEMLSLHETGMLWLRGPNIFEGYLGDEKKTAEVIQGGWFKTGDLGRMDEDGFLYIEGRVSRFSKIGGEMVPHETVETKISKAYNFCTTEERIITIVGVPDEAKGEALILLSTKEIDVSDLRSKLSETGIPNLWIPKIIYQVETIPVLGSGKLDLKKCKELALQLKKEKEN